MQKMEKPEYKARMISPNTELEVRLLTIPLIHLNDEGLLRQLVGILKKYLEPDCFRYELHKKLFNSLVKLYDKRALNDITLARITAGLIDDNDDIVINETVDYITWLCNYELPLGDIHIIQLEHLCKIMSEHYAKFKLACICHEAIELAQTPENISYEVQKEIIEKLNSVKMPVKSTGQTLQKAVLSELDFIYEEEHQDYKLITTGFNALDNIITGIDKNSITGILGNRGEGKTTLCLQIAREIALQVPDEEVLYFSLEMSEQQVVRKLVTINTDGQINPFKHLKSNNEAFRTSYSNELAKISEVLPIYIIERLKPNTFENIKLAIEARKAESNKKLSAIFIDHWHLINFREKDLTTTEAQNQCIPLLNDMAKEYNTRIFVITQRDKESRKTKKRPQMDEVKGSSDLGDICHNFFSIHRPECGLNQTGIETCKIYVDKSRFGPLGECELVFNNNKVLFEDVDNFTKAVTKRYTK